MANGIIQNGGSTVAKTNPNPKKTLTDLIKAYEPEIKKALPDMIKPERFTRMILSAVSQTPQLAACTPMSFLGAMLQSAQTGLEPNTTLGQCFLIPYKNHGVDEVQFQIGYKGLIDLAYRSGQVSSIDAQTVYERDRFEYELGLDPKLKHVPATSDRGDPTHYYAVVRMKDGGYCFSVMSVDDIKKHAAKYSQSYKSSYSPWAKNFDEMAKKTCLKKALKYAPLSSEAARNISTDETIKTEIADDMFSVPDTTVYEDAVPAADPATGEVIEEG